MTQPTYAQLSAVLELYELYQRHSPAGPYRLELYLKPGDPVGWQAEAGRLAASIDELIRGASCLIANQHFGAARHVVNALWAEVRSFRREAQFAWAGRVSTAEPPQFEEISAQLAAADLSSAGVVNLLGDVLLVYLEQLALRSPELAEQVPLAARRIRASGGSS